MSHPIIIAAVIAGAAALVYLYKKNWTGAPDTPAEVTVPARLRAHLADFADRALSYALYYRSVHEKLPDAAAAKLQTLPAVKAPPPLLLSALREECGMTVSQWRAVLAKYYQEKTGQLPPPGVDLTMAVENLLTDAARAQAAGLCGDAAGGAVPAMPQ